MEVVCFGEILLRLNSIGYEKLFQSKNIEASFCGGEANVAVSLANYGVPCEFVTKLPDNEIGQAAICELRKYGVGTKYIAMGEGRMGIYYLEKGVSQRPSKIIYDRKNSVISEAEKEDFAWEQIFSRADWFHFTGINPALSENLIGICIEACKIARAKGVLISLDLNYRGKLWSEHQAQLVMKDIMPYVDVCVANEEDIQKMLGLEIENNNVESGQLNYQSYTQIAKKICDIYNCKYVAITLRESISASENNWSAILYCQSEDRVYSSTKYNIRIVDRVGGGDSFAAGIIYGLINNKPNQEVIDFATAASCLKHTIEGDFNRVSTEEVYALVNGSGSGRVQR